MCFALTSCYWLHGQAASLCEPGNLKATVENLKILVLRNPKLLTQQIEECCSGNKDREDCLYAKILYQKTEGNLTEATQIYRQLQKKASPDWQPYLLTERLNLLLLKGQYEALLSLIDSLEQNNKTLSLASKADIAAHKGVVYQYQGKYPTSLDALLVARKNYQLIDDSLGMVRMLHNIGNIHAITGGYDKALEVFQQVAVESKALNIKRVEGIAEYSLGNLYVTQEQDEMAYPHYLNALAIHQQRNDLRGLGQVYNAIGLIHHRLQQPDSALHFLENALPIRQQIGDLRGEAYTQLNLGRVHLVKENLRQAEDYTKESLAIADRLKLGDIRQDVYELLALIAEQKGNTVAALRYKNQQLSIKDSILGVQKVREVIETAAAVESISDQRKPNKALRVYGLAFLLFTVLCIYFLAFQKRPISSVDNDTFKEKLNKTNRELAAVNMNAASDTAFFEELIAHIEHLNQNENSHALKKLQRTIENHHQFRSDWQDTIVYFKEIYPRFFQQMIQKHPQLTSNDLRHAAYVRMGLSAKETAPIFGVKYTTIEVARYRLKKKLGLRKEEKLFSYLFDIQ